MMPQPSMATSAASSSRISTRSRSLAWSWHYLGLSGVLALAAFLNLYGLAQNGYGNTYYASAVRSMLASWHTFFFASFDPGGFVSVDKPPLAFWIQTLSARLFGYNGLSLIVPQAVAGIAAVGLLYHLVRRTWGRHAGLIAALILALTPISVAINRYNNPDPWLVLFLLLAAWAGMRATETGRLRYIMLTGALVGLGVNVKMLQALIVLPALGLMYLLGSRLPFKRRISGVALAAIALLVVGGGWMAVVDLTPADLRPYVGGSSNNTVRDLLFGYNGLSRLFGRQGSGVASGGGQGGGGAMAGSPGLLRLFSEQLAGQISWLLPLAAVGFVAAWRPRFRLPLSRPQQSLVLWSVWLLTHMLVFSYAQGTFHEYYTVMLAPAIAALGGAGTVALWRAYRNGGWRAWLLPLALVLTAALEVQILAPYPAYSRILLPIVVGGSGLAAAILSMLLLRHRSGGSWSRYLAAFGIAALLVSPGVWSTTPLLAATSGNTPTAGPTQRSGGGTSGPTGRDGSSTSGQVSSAMLEYLQANRSGYTYLVAVSDTTVASPIIISTGEAVMAMGGYRDRDSILTADRLEQLVADHSVRYFLLGSSGQGSRGGTSQSDDEVSRWIQENCTVVPAFSSGQRTTLYEYTQ